MNHVAFGRTRALEDQTFATLEHSDEYSAYIEYLGELDRVPVLRDPVALPPAFPPDFRQGQRPDARKRARDDGEARRESRAVEIEKLYREYVGVDTTANSVVTREKAAKRPKNVPPKATRTKTPKRRKRRKR
jgi:hypothetical protein